MDEMRVSIRAQLERLASLEQHSQAIDGSIHRERDLVDIMLGVSPAAYLSRMRAEREAIARNRSAAEGDLAVLQTQATQAFGELRAIEGAAERHRDDRARVKATAEQGQLDDFSAAQFARMHAEKRRSSAR
jgi:predicted  nucleic acid-binding Zn-ribbon protein